MQAGKELAAFIAGLGIDASARLQIVAHSHGGNVALYALRHAGTEKVEGIAFLATPFLNFGPQNFPLVGFRLLPFAITSTVFVIVFAVLMALEMQLGIPLLRQAPVSAVPALVVLLVVALVVACVVAFLAGRVVRGLLSETDELLRQISKLCEHYQAPTPQVQRVLILRKAGDEASAALESGRFIEWLATWLWGQFSWLIGLFGAARMALTVFVERHRWTWWVLLPLLIIVAVLVWTSPEVVSVPFGYVFAGFVIAVLVVFGIQALLLGSILCLSVLRFGLGPDLAAMAHIRTTSQATPLGLWKVELLPAAGFAHSEIHEDPQVGDRIARWLLTEEGRESPNADA